MMPAISVARSPETHFSARCRSLFFHPLDNPHVCGPKAHLGTKFGKRPVGCRLETGAAGRDPRIAVVKARIKSTTRRNGFC